MRGAISLLPQYAFMAWCLVKHRDNFTFTFTCRSKVTYILHECGVEIYRFYFRRFPNLLYVKWYIMKILMTLQFYICLDKVWNIRFMCGIMFLYKWTSSSVGNLKSQNISFENMCNPNFITPSSHTCYIGFVSFESTYNSLYMFSMNSNYNYV